MCLWLTILSPSVLNPTLVDHQSNFPAYQKITLSYLLCCLQMISFPTSATLLSVTRYKFLHQRGSPVKKPSPSGRGYREKSLRTFLFRQNPGSLLPAPDLGLVSHQEKRKILKKKLLSFHEQGLCNNFQAQIHLFMLTFHYMNLTISKSRYSYCRWLCACFHCSPPALWRSCVGI